MQIPLPQTDFLKVSQHSHSHTVETPVKKNHKNESHSHLKTADSPTMLQSASKLSIADIDAEELFENFSRIVTISESNESTP